MNIQIVSYHFYPENTPRAFRAWELAKEFARRTYQLEVIIPDNDFNYDKIEKEYSLKVKKVRAGFLFAQKSRILSSQNLKSTFKFLPFKKKMQKFLSEILHFIYPGGRPFEWGICLMGYLLKSQKNDLILSIGLPFASHLGVGIARLIKRKNWKTALADYGDPFSTQIGDGNGKKFHFLIEKWVLTGFDKIIIPVINQMPAYINFKDQSNIHVIPQGLNLNEYEVATYSKGPITKFAYFGMFYPGIRNPKFFFTELISLKKNFEFHLYTDQNNQESFSLVKPFLSVLEKKLYIHDLIPRKQCIYEMGIYDFLVSFLNKGQLQVPSKLIDYAISKRPVLDIEETTFDPQIFYNFLSGDYSFYKGYDLSKHDIKVVVDKILSL